MLAGNGGSYDLACHMEEEFICKFEHDRKPLPAIAFKVHSSTSNDYGYQNVFLRQLQALGKPGDIFIGISTSGNSINVNACLGYAPNMGITPVDFPRIGKSTAEIQENQLKLMHDICRIVEKAFVYAKGGETH